MISNSHVTNLTVFYLISIILDHCHRCRWIPNLEEHLIYVNYDSCVLNILDTQKGVLTLKNPIFLEKREDWGNLLFYALRPFY